MKMNKRKKRYFMRKQKLLDVVGGMGAETTGEFYVRLVKMFRDKDATYPGIIIDNVHCRSAWNPLLFVAMITKLYCLF